MTITPTGNSPAPAAPSPTASAGGADFNMFLKLLTTQMQNQDPLDPMDTSEYTQQLVQYSQVEQSVRQTGVLKDILARLSVQDMTQASGLLGRSVEVDSAVSGLTADTPAQWRWSGARAAASVNAEIIDASGRTVATPVVSPGASGTLLWDGTLATGGKAPAGSYTLRMSASDAAGNAIPTTVRTAGIVGAVTRGDAGVAISLAGLVFPVEKLIAVSPAQ